MQIDSDEVVVQTSFSLLKNFVRFHLIFCRGEKKIFFINNDFSLKGTEVKELIIRGQSILDVEDYYADEDIDEVYVFSITSSDELRVNE